MESIGSVTKKDFDALATAADQLGSSDVGEKSGPARAACKQIVQAVGRLPARGKAATGGHGAASGKPLDAKATPKKAKKPAGKRGADEVTPEDDAAEPAKTPKKKTKHTSAKNLAETPKPASAKKSKASSKKKSKKQDK